MLRDVKTLNQFIVERQADFEYAKGELSSLLSDIGTAVKIINREVNKAGLVNILGSAHEINVQGEEVKKLDMYANDMLIIALSSGEDCCVIASEENENIVEIPTQNNINPAKYVVVFDPLDGSSNIDVNASIGTIFAIYRRISEGDGPGTAEDCMQKGRNIVASGYVIYGSSTMLVYTTGNGVNGFTLDPSIGEFCLSHPKIKLPERGNIYSLNDANFSDFSEGLKRFVNYLKGDAKTEIGKFSARYIGTLVADIHRNLLKGGIFIYPDTAKAPQGKLRLIYENNPMAFLLEQANGKATDGHGVDILDIQPTDLHQRTPLFIGNKDLVDLAEEFIKKYG
ncbi:MAG: class 1 fructose-bisphosphatase [Bacteroidetes bacterium]|nr:class 1 fructose-bisphosphatase [Bacteroidota bacterium]